MSLAELGRFAEAARYEAEAIRLAEPTQQGERKSMVSMAAKTAAGQNVSAIMGGARTMAVQRS